MLGLTESTDTQWVKSALANLNAILIDHAHCEIKAASNAMSLVVRYSNRPWLVSTLSALAEEEISHFRQVYQRMIEQGLSLGAPPVDSYAATLRTYTHQYGGATLINRLLIAALIEARSCERFKILSDHIVDPSLRDFYKNLLASEASHYRIFVDLALQEGTHQGLASNEIRDRLQALAVCEGQLIRSLQANAERATIHG